MYKRCLALAICFFLFLSVGAEGANRQLSEGEQSVYSYKTAKQLLASPNQMQRAHRVGKMGFCVTNWGFFGSKFNPYGGGRYQMKESLRGCFNPDPDDPNQLAPSFEYPYGTNLNYLFQGALWMGAIVPAADPTPTQTKDTVASLGADGWRWIEEFYPDGPAPKGEIIERTIRPVVPNENYAKDCISPDAVSEQDIIAKYSDTLTPIISEDIIDPQDQRHHQPIGLEITQKSYAWSYSYAEDFILIDFSIKNISEDSIQKLYMGLYVDGDCLHWSEGLNEWAKGARDDITGFKKEVYDPVLGKNIPIHTAWIADNDGFLEDEQNNPPGSFHDKSCTAVTGVRIVREPPIPPPPFDTAYKKSFNWWVGVHGGETPNPDNDWGPWLQKNLYIWESKKAYGRAGKFNFPNDQADVLGTPGGDLSKYFIMSNGEWDSNQVYADVDLTEEGWIEPSPTKGRDLADGYDTRYLFSFGPLQTIQPGDSIVLTIAYIGGENFHVRPDNCKNNLVNSYNPWTYEENLNFDEFAINSTWAYKVYDNPGIDTDGDGYAGETDEEGNYITGDGVPDFAGPPPPRSPELDFETSSGKVKVRWNGRETEEGVDDFTGKQDFEGYRIYISETGLPDDFILTTSFDKIDYSLYYYNSALSRYIHKWPSVTFDSLQSWFGIGFGDDPLAYFDSANSYVYDGDYKKIGVDTVSSLDTLEISAIESDSTFRRFYFTPNDWNLIGLDSLKVYKAQIDSGLITPVDDEYYEYQYEVSGLLPSRAVYLAVSAFDYGDPQTGLESLESSKMINATPVYSFPSLEEVKSRNLKIVVYPNPYRIDGGYDKLPPGWGEDPDRSGWTPFDRRINFVNLPERCTIRIYTLDGDLVREIEHDGRGSSNPTMDYWNLISRNTQAVVSGIYLFSVEDKDTGEIQIGKFVVIK